MPSSINPNNINGNYPIAGQDNDSQGFRDNFTNIRNNFTFARNEINELQNKAILKSPLSGSLTVDNDLNGNTVSNAVFDNTRQKWKEHLSASGSIDIDYTQGLFHYIEMGGSVTLNFVNFSNTAHCQVKLHVYCPDPSYTLTLPSLSSGVTIYGKSLIQNINFSHNIANQITIRFPTVGDRFYEVGSTPRSGLYIVELQKVLDKKYAYTYNTSFELHIPNDASTVIINANAAISTGNIIFPTPSSDGQNLTLAFISNTVASVTLIGGAYTILSAISNASPNSYAKWTFHYNDPSDDNLGVWVRTG